MKLYMWLTAGVLLVGVVIGATASIGVASGLAGMAGAAHLMDLIEAALKARKAMLERRKPTRVCLCVECCSWRIDSYTARLKTKHTDQQVLDEALVELEEYLGVPLDKR